MQDNFDSRALVTSLRACAKQKNLHKGNKIHADIVRIGLFETNIYVGSTLVTLYASCGSIAEAQDVFDRLPERNVVSWSALMSGFAEYGPCEDVLKYFERMQLEGITPDAVTFVCVLKACASIGDIEKGLEIRDLVVKEGTLGTNSFVGSALIHLFAKWGSLQRAQEVSDSFPVRNVVLWNSLISGYAQHGLGEDVFRCFQQMQHEGAFPNTITIVSFLNTCGVVGDLKTGTNLHANYIRSTAMEENAFVCNSLIDMYGKCHLLEKAQEVFERLSIRDVVSWSSLIRGYAQHGYTEKALNHFVQMQLEGIAPNTVTCICILNVCAKTGTADKGQVIHAKVEQQDLMKKDIAVGNALVDMYTKCSLLDKAQEVFDTLPARNLVAWNALISGYVEHGYEEAALNCFSQLQLEDVSPDKITYVCILDACGRLGAGDMGEKIHAEIAKEGLLETDAALGTALVDMYAKCGMFAKAEAVFDTLSLRGADLWSSLVVGCALHGEWGNTIVCYDHMQLEGILPDVTILVWVLKACGEVRAVEKGQEIYACACKCNGNIEVESAVIEMYIRCGLLSTAQEVFDTFHIRDAVMWSVIVAGYTQQGLYDGALKCFKQMQLDGVSPNTSTYIYILKSCGCKSAIDEGIEIHAEIMREGLVGKNAVLGNSLVDMYAKCGLFGSAQVVFDTLPTRDAVSWNVLISGYVQHEHAEQALMCFNLMQLENISPSIVTFLCILKACGNVGAVEEGQQVHIEIEREGLLRKNFGLGTALVDMYAKCGWFARAQDIFLQLSSRDVVSWSALIAEFVNHGHNESALNCFEQMQLEGIAPNMVTYISILKACGSVGARDKGQGIHNEIIQCGLMDNDNSIGNAVLDMYIKCGMLEKAQELFTSFPSQSVAAWNSVIAGCTAHGQGEEALVYFEQMQQQGIPPNEVTYLYLLKVCGSLGAASKGHEIHVLIDREGLLANDTAVGNAILDMYAKCGCLAKAQEVFNKALFHNVVSWGSLIRGCALLGTAEHIFFLFDKMVGESIQPDVVIITSVLHACSHMGLFDQCHMCFEIMRAGYGLVPTLDHYSCLVDLYCRAGHMDLAFSVVNEIPFTVSLSVWHSVLCASQKLGNMELGRLAFNHALELNESDSAAHIFMYKIYLDAERQ